MNSPICGLCANSNNLCSACKQKLDNGEATQADIDLARAINTLAGRFPALEKAEFNRVQQVENLLFVTVPQGTAGQLIGRRGAFIKELASLMGKSIKVVEESSDTREIIQKVLFPASFKGVNVLYKSGDKKSYRVRVPRIDKNRIEDTKALEKLFGELLGGDVQIVFE